LPSASRPIVGLATLAYVALIGVCLFKGKTFTALLGALIPLFLLIGAFRLARPGSPWALLRYRRNLSKQQRAEARFRPTARHGRRDSGFLPFSARGSLRRLMEWSGRRDLRVRLMTASGRRLPRTAHDGKLIARLAEHDEESSWCYLDEVAFVVSGER
jgi:hypothetical protein